MTLIVRFLIFKSFLKLKMFIYLSALDEQTQTLYNMNRIIVFIVLTLFTLCSCQKDECSFYNLNLSKEKFFSLPDDASVYLTAITDILNQSLKQDGIKEITSRYGWPSWLNTMETETDTAYYVIVPFVATLDNVETINYVWYIKWNSIGLTYRVVERNELCDDDQWIFYYYDQKILNKIGKYRFFMPEMLKSTYAITICREAWVEVGGYWSYKGTHCTTQFISAMEYRTFFEGWGNGYINQGGGGGGNGGTSDTGNNSQANAVNTAGLPQTAINNINKAIQEIKDNCLGSNLIGKLGDANITIKINPALNNNQEYSAYYDPKNNTINFFSENSISSIAMMHELIHAYQKIKYGEAFTNSLNPPYIGLPQFELEAHIIMDISGIYPGYRNFAQDEGAIKNYEKLIQKLKKNEFIPDAQSNQTFNSLLGPFMQHYPEYGKGVPGYNLQPSVYKTAKVGC